MQSGGRLLRLPLKVGRLEILRFLPPRHRMEEIRRWRSAQGVLLRPWLELEVLGDSPRSPRVADRQQIKPKVISLGL